MARRGADRPNGRGRVAVLLVVCCAVFVLFFARLAWMQFAMADHYAEKAAEASSASYTVEQHAARGAITDRNGTVLARDTTVYDVYLRVPAPPGTDLTETVQTLQALTGGKDVETQLAAFCSAVSAGELLVLESVDDETMAALYRSGLVQSGAIRLAARGERSWPDGTLLPHALGFTGPITAEEWPSAQEKGLAMDSIVGQSGLEEAYDDLLRGQDGQLLINTGLDGAVRATIQQRTATPGATLVLTLDASLQATLQQALRERIETLQTTAFAGGGRECRAGAAVVVDVKTGGILAAANWPGYDLNTYRTDYAALSADPGAPLLDRAFQGLYAPGSAFKPAVAAAALTAGIDPNATVNCTGRYLYYSGYQPGCLQYGHSGPVDMRTALEQSCNIFFYDVGRRLGVDTFSSMARQLGLSQPTGVEVREAEGRLTWSTDDNYQAGLTLMAAIGQGNTAVTPAQLAVYAATLATNGQRPTLHFADRALNTATGETVWQYEPQFTTVPSGETVFGPIRDGMKRMAQTNRYLREASVVCAAKTGSPQLADTLPNGTHYVNSVLIGYAPADDPQIAVAVVLEYGGGGSNATPILRAVLDAWFD
ncbi:peptidoglycan D,D-transpeptidase FtsI family protein [Subdoligranulum variabile]|uniref:Penicillin-binding protein, transpeptidase domain protein n=1 Tax=Subdoligranulum variabile DSM 15176 TaxID=411471 RepID=D1PNX3_9FIRM|nr:penicillin-binding transpeptidase domain-containing protein [Subdoligranulum variabile]EFB75469.1 penicillin-binding protein, transpeptidase domain protein [Subdoligranulum variabile DSM 15176]UWP68923.1 penicillin-binding transpeptidase domain-containing protein [Subdoligranulum variabile]